jgi:transposase-like protein
MVKKGTCGIQQYFCGEQVLSHLHHLFNAAQCQAYIHTLRWKDRPAIIAWVSRQGAVVIQATKDFTVQTVQKAADLAVHAGSRLYTDSASSYRAVQGYVHFSLLKPYLRMFRGISKFNLPGYLGFFQFLRNFRQRNACEQAELILQAAKVFQSC